MREAETHGAAHLGAVGLGEAEEVGDDVGQVPVLPRAGRLRGGGGGREGEGEGMGGRGRGRGREGERERERGRE